MTEIQAAVGRIQLRKLDGWLERRRRNALHWDRALENISGIRRTLPPASVEHAYYKYYVFVEPAALKSGWDRDRLLSEMRASGVPVFFTIDAGPQVKAVCTPDVARDVASELAACNGVLDVLTSGLGAGARIV